MTTSANLFEMIAASGTDEGYVPRITSEFRPTDAPAGSPEKIAVLRRRVELGLPLWHKLDCLEYLTGATAAEEYYSAAIANHSHA